MRGSPTLSLCVALSALACSEPAEEPPYLDVDAAHIATHVDRLREFETIGAIPVNCRVVGGQHVELYGPGRCVALLQELAQRSEAAGLRMHLDCILVGQHDRAVPQAQPLGAKEQLGGPGAHRIFAPVQNIAQDDMGKLIDEEGRHCGQILFEQREICFFYTGVRQQVVAKLQDHLIVFPRVRVGEFGQETVGNGDPRILQQFLVQGDFGGAGFGHRPDLGALKIGPQKIVGQNKPAVGVALQQVKSGSEPEVGHVGVSPRLFARWVHAMGPPQAARCGSARRFRLR